MLRKPIGGFGYLGGKEGKEAGRFLGEGQLARRRVPACALPVLGLRTFHLPSALGLPSTRPQNKGETAAEGGWESGSHRGGPAGGTRGSLLRDPEPPSLGLGPTFQVPLTLNSSV